MSPETILARLGKFATSSIKNMYLARAHHEKLSLFQLIVTKIWALKVMNNLLEFIHTCGWSSPTLQLQLVCKPAGVKNGKHLLGLGGLRII